MPLHDVIMTSHCCQRYAECLVTTLCSAWQCTATPRHARATVELQRQEMPNFLSSNLWPLNSPDLSPVDYKIWAVMQHRVYIPQTNPWAIVWMGGSSMSGAVSNRRLLKRLLTSGKEDIKRVSVYAKGGHFECSLWTDKCWFCPYLLHAMWLVWLLHL